jgi:hypothetical protein
MVEFGGDDIIVKQNEITYEKALEKALQEALTLI